MDINNSIMDFHNSIHGYPQYGTMGIHKSELWISINRIMDIHNRIMDIHNSELWISINTCIWCQLRSQYVRLPITDDRYPGQRRWHQNSMIMDIHKSNCGSINRIMDIHNRIMDIHQSNYGYQQIELWISINRRNIMECHKGDKDHWLWISINDYGYP